MSRCNVKKSSSHFKTAHDGSAPEPNTRSPPGDRISGKRGGLHYLHLRGEAKSSCNPSVESKIGRSASSSGKDNATRKDLRNTNGEDKPARIAKKDEGGETHLDFLPHLLNEAILNQPNLGATKCVPCKKKTISLTRTSIEKNKQQYE